MREKIAAAVGPVGARMMEIAQFYVDAYARMYPGVDGCGLHDPLAVAIAEDQVWPGWNACASMSNSRAR